MNRFYVLCFLLLSAVSVLVWALPAQSQTRQKGVVEGYISDSLYESKLQGVEVKAVSTGDKTLTDDKGYFRIKLPTGKQELKFDYEGYKKITRQIVVKSGQTRSLRVTMGSKAAKLEEMIVKGRLVGEMRARNMQMASDGYKSIISSDAISELPDQNVAESLTRLPGLSVARDQGEGRFVVIRGMDPNLNRATIEGMPLFSPDSEERAVLLDVIPSGSAKSLKVSKTVLPDQPHDSVGGHIDIEMPSAFDRKGRTLRGTIQTNYDTLAEEYGGRGSVTFGDRFGLKDNFGFLTSISYDERDYASDNQEAGPLVQQNGNWVPEEMEFREYDLSRDRLGLMTNLEYRPQEGTNYYLHATYNQMEDIEVRRAAVYETDPEGVEPSGKFSGEGDWEISNEIKDREENLQEYVLSLGGENNVSDWSLDYQGGFSHAEEDTPDDTEIVFALEDTMKGSYDGVGGYHPDISYEDEGTDPHDPANFKLDEIEDENQLSQLDSWFGEFNVRRDLDLELPVYLKTGFSLRLNEKENDTDTYTGANETQLLSDMQGNSGQARKEFFDTGLPLSDYNLVDVFRENREDFDLTKEKGDSKIEDFVTNEDIYAGYLMGNVKWGDMKFIPGVRVEYTSYDTDGHQYLEGEDKVKKASDDNSYTNVMPGLHYRWNFKENMIFRASWTNTIARPTYGEARIGAEVDADGNVERGNPELDPYKSMNYDVSLRWYRPKLGGISIAGFYKDVDDFIFPRTIPNASRFDGDLTTFQNGQSGEIMGVELALQHQLSFLPSPLDGLGFDASTTFVDSEATVPPSGGHSSREVPFYRQSDTVANGSLFYDKYGLSIRVAGSYKSEYLDELGEKKSQDRYIDDHFQLDISTQYAVNENLTFFTDFINVNEEPLRAYWDKTGSLSQYEEYGMKVKGGIKWSL